MNIFAVLCFLILNACDAEIQNFLLADSSEAAFDSHSTFASRVGRRNSFMPSQSNRNYFRDLISHTEDLNGNTMEYNAIDPAFSSFLSSKQRKQSEIHGGTPYKSTREVWLPKQGRITGVVKEMHLQSRMKNVDQFLGVPYASPPVGSRRFMPPSSPLPWSDVKRANKLEAVCPQRLPSLHDPNVNINKGRYDQIKRLLPYLQRESEDCLYLNLYVTSYGEFECFSNIHK